MCGVYRRKRTMTLKHPKRTVMVLVSLSCAVTSSPTGTRSTRGPPPQESKLNFIELINHATAASSGPPRTPGDVLYQETIDGIRLDGHESTFRFSFVMVSNSIPASWDITKKTIVRWSDPGDDVLHCRAVRSNPSKHQNLAFWCLVPVQVRTNTRDHH